MDSMKKIVAGTTLILLAFAAPAPAAERICSSFEGEPEHFESLYEQAKDLGRDICLVHGQRVGTGVLAEEFRQFAAAAYAAADRAFAGKSFHDEMLAQMESFIDLAQAGVDKSALPSFVVQQDQRDLDSAQVSFGFSHRNERGTADYDAPECRPERGPDCRALLESLQVAIEQYKRPYVRRSGRALAEGTRVLEAAWDRYFEQARSQTLLDAMLTTTLEQDHLARQKLVGPMQRQWFALHPSIVIENVSAAADGDEVSEALAVEWFGVNWWNGRTSPVGYPFGISVASVFSDRASVDDAGHGLMFHFDNSLSIGWADHGGDDGFHVTVDVLNLFAKKKQRWDEFRSAIDRLGAQARDDGDGG